LHIYLLGLILL